MFQRGQLTKIHADCIIIDQNKNVAHADDQQPLEFITCFIWHVPCNSAIKP